jgi:prepilin-type N-terminal cleavage/methylation domain-containing protein
MTGPASAGSVIYKDGVTMLNIAMRHHAAEVERKEATEAGFTLIELMVVLLIIAILLAIAIPTFLGVTNTAGDRSAQSDLTNALTEAKALYEVNQSYSQGGAGYTPAVFTSQAPELVWQTTACSGTPSNCISYDVLSSATPGDGQALLLAAYSSKTQTCWYALDLESTPASGVTGGIESGGTNKNAMSNAGVFYGYLKQATTCIASGAADPTHAAAWGGDYTAAGSVY